MSLVTFGEVREWEMPSRGIYRTGLRMRYVNVYVNGREVGMLCCAKASMSKKFSSWEPNLELQDYLLGWFTRSFNLEYLKGRIPELVAELDSFGAEGEPRTPNTSLEGLGFTG